MPTSSPSVTSTCRASGSGRAAPKLRDSCQACASSKVKCTKEKPKCSRCAKRGLECEYLATKRAGRTSYKKQAAEAAKRLQIGIPQGATSAAAAAAAATTTRFLGVAGNNAIHHQHQHLTGLPTTTTITTTSSADSSWFSLNAFAAANGTTARPFGGLDPAAFDGSSTLFEDVGSMNSAMSSSTLNQLPKFDEYFEFATSPTCLELPTTSTTESQVSDANFFSINNHHNMDCVDLCSESSNSSSYEPTTNNNNNTNRFADFDDAGYPGLPGDVFSVLEPSLAASSRRSSAHTTAVGSPQQPCHSLDFMDYHHGSLGPHTSCLPWALDLLKQLTPVPSTPCSMSGSRRASATSSRHHHRRHRSSVSAAPSIQTVIAHNRQTIDAVRSMLECPCSGDDFLTMVLTLVICKVFGWYAAAARVSSSSSSSSSLSSAAPSSRCNSISSNGSQSPIERQQQLPHPHEQLLSVGDNYLCVDDNGGDDDDDDVSSSKYMAGQLVLSELHRVQRIVNQLSKRLTSGAQSSRSRSPLSETGSALSLGGCDEEFSMSIFSAPLLQQFEKDLRSGLKKLSLDIVRELEREYVES